MKFARLHLHFVVEVQPVIASTIISIMVTIGGKIAHYQGRWVSNHCAYALARTQTARDQSRKTAVIIVLFVMSAIAAFMRHPVHHDCCRDILIIAATSVFGTGIMITTASTHRCLQDGARYSGGLERGCGGRDNT